MWAASPQHVMGQISAAQMKYAVAWKDAFMFVTAARKFWSKDISRLEALLEALKAGKASLTPEHRRPYSKARQAVKELQFELAARGACPTIVFRSDEDGRTFDSKT